MIWEYPFGRWAGRESQTRSVWKGEVGERILVFLLKGGEDLWLHISYSKINFLIGEWLKAKSLSHAVCATKINLPHVGHIWEAKSSFDFSILYSYMIDQWPSEQGRVSNMELIGLVRIWKCEHGLSEAIYRDLRCAICEYPWYWKCWLQVPILLRHNKSFSAQKGLHNTISLETVHSVMRGGHTFIFLGI
jgi:hypothetical protein